MRLIQSLFNLSLKVSGCILFEQLIHKEEKLEEIIREDLGVCVLMNRLTRVLIETARVNRNQ